MKRNVLFAVAFFATLAASAQNIAAVSPSNKTTMHQTLDDAVSEAENGSIIYLPGGGFQISSDTKIEKKLTIMGVSHRADADNADGATVVSGNLNFVGGSSGSAVTGIYLSGNINIGDEENSVSNMTVRFCNVNSVQVLNSQSSGLFVNQSYLRNNSNFGGCNVRLENCILHSLQGVNGGIINHNVVTSNHYVYNNSTYTLRNVNNSSITNNFFTDWYGHTGSSCDVSNNCIGRTTTWGENSILFEKDTNWGLVFEAHKGVTINSNYKVKGTIGKNAATDGTDLGIYGGSGFKEEKSLAPIPRIVSKKVDEHTDGSGMLHIEVTVKAD